jgi:serine/threonine-protein phosphatase 5
MPGLLLKKLTDHHINISYDGPHLSPNGITREFVEALLEDMKAQKKLHRKYACQIMLAVKKIFENDPTIVDIPVPEGSKLTVCGDIHGQFYDLMNIFKMNGLPSETNMYLVGSTINSVTFPKLISL